LPKSLIKRVSANQYLLASTSFGNNGMFEITCLRGPLNKLPEGDTDLIEVLTHFGQDFVNYTSWVKLNHYIYYPQCLLLYSIIDQPQFCSIHRIFIHSTKMMLY
jgi:hypothetical protein